MPKKKNSVSTEDFKKQAVSLSYSTSINEAARTLGIPVGTISYWRKQLREEERKREQERLEREQERIQKENEIRLENAGLKDKISILEITSENNKRERICELKEKKEELTKTIAVLRSTLAKLTLQEVI